MRSPGWYLQRLRAMSAAEILTRCRDTAAHGLQNAGFLLALDPPLPEDPGACPRWLGLPPRDAAARYVAASDAIAAGRWRIFDREFAFAPGSIDWNRDPLTGVVAPSRFGPSLDLHDRKVVGDIKYLWEPNRHLQLVVPAQAYETSGDERHLALLRELLESWLVACPYPRGPNWSSGLELAIRLINWSLCWQMIGGGNSPAFRGTRGSAFRDAWLRSVYQHLHFIRSHYSRHSSANNHLMGEAAGVFVAGCTWPLWPEVRRWCDEAFGIVEREAEAQVAPDGVDREQTLSYQRFVLEFLVICRVAGRGVGRRFRPSFDGRLEAMTGFLDAMTDVGGNLPMIGDADDGAVVQWSPDHRFDALPALNAATRRVLGLPEGRPLPPPVSDVVRWLVGEAPLAAEGDGAAAADLRRAFPEGGYHILGCDLGTAAEVKLVVDSGPLGYLSIAAHGHADALSVWLSVGGREMLVDPGTFLYHGAPEWRAYFRGTPAHNTIVVDGLDQSEQGGAFLWTRHARARCLAFETTSEGERFSAEHDGYRRLQDPVTHRRDIQREARSFRIVDTLECRLDHRVEQWWHFSERCEVTREGSTIVARYGASVVKLHLSEGFADVELVRGPEAPPGGWVSRRYGVKEPSTSVHCVARMHGTTKFITRIECFMEQSPGELAS